MRIEFARWRACPQVQDLSASCCLGSFVAKSAIFGAIFGQGISVRVLEAQVSQRTLLASGSLTQLEINPSISLCAMEVPLWVFCAAFSGGLALWVGVPQGSTGA